MEIKLCGTIPFSITFSSDSHVLFLCPFLLLSSYHIMVYVLADKMSTYSCYYCKEKPSVLDFATSGFCLALLLFNGAIYFLFFLLYIEIY